jgi:hypothetical protein
MGDVFDTKSYRERCDKCFYRDKFSRTCDYCLIEGKSRGCDPAECDKWQPRFGGRFAQKRGKNEELS